MVISNLFFFDKFGKNLNLDWDSDGSFWKGTIFFPEVSTYLFDNENIFILEKVSTDYKFPQLVSGDNITFEWELFKNEDEIFLFDVEKDIELDNLFINKKESSSVSYSDLYSTTTKININLPLQVNIAFNPKEEVNYTRKLLVYTYNDSNTSAKTKIAELNIYGEGLDEDERFGVWARNFGIKFNKEDANILKDYDIKEAFPDWSKLNTARKELLVNKDQIFPYIGTYKGLSNFINLLGYKDVLQVKEYWKNINNKSPYFNKQTLVDITDYLDDGKIDNMNILDKNKNIKFGKQFRKTECLALVYQFTKESGTFDDDGIPVVEETTDFTVNEMFYKLNKLKDKLKDDIIPINVKIKDIIGEFVYFQKITIKFWSDRTPITDIRFNDSAEVEIYPTINTNIVLRSLEPLFRKDYSSGIDFGEFIINDGAKNPFENAQKYAPSDIDAIVSNIEEFYTEIKNQRYPNLGERLTWEQGDDPERIIGAPVVLDINTGRFTFENFKGVTFDDLQGNGGLNPYFTLGNIDFKNFYEITWKISKASPNPYNFEYRGKIEDLHTLPHFLPYAGTYRVTAHLHDFGGNTSVFSKLIEVQDDLKPEIVAITRIEDKFDYKIDNLDNVQLIDFGPSYNYYPKVNVLDNEESVQRINVYKNLLEWVRVYKNAYGLGESILDAELYDTSTNSYIPFTDPSQNHPYKSYWGLGENQFPLTLSDFDNATLESGFFQRICNTVYTDDFLAGFYMWDPQAGDQINISSYSSYTIPSFATLQDLVDTLNASTHKGIKKYNYELLDTTIDILGTPTAKTVIHAQAEYFAKDMYHVLDVTGGGTTQIDQYTFFTPEDTYSQRVKDNLSSISTSFNEEMLFMFAKTSDMLNGNVDDPTFWETTKNMIISSDVQKGFIPTLYDQNSFNLNDIKIFDSSFTIPENCPVFFNINNLDGKSEYVWTLIDSNREEEIVRVTGVPFFVWKFKDLGNFKLKVQVTDNRGTVYENEIDRLINVVDKIDYIKYTETRLNRRKIEILNKFN